MPKCLDCGNIKTFSYREDSYNEAIYDEAGDLVDVTYKVYSDVAFGMCMECKSENIEGEL